MQYGYETFQNVKPALKNHIAKNIYLGAKVITNIQQDYKPALSNLF